MLIQGVFKMDKTDLGDGPEGSKSWVYVYDTSHGGSISLPKLDCIFPPGCVGGDSILRLRGHAMPEFSVWLEHRHCWSLFDGDLFDKYFVKI